jgi:hypothetical protein
MFPSVIPLLFSDFLVVDDEFTVEITNVIYCKWDTLVAQYLGLLFGSKPEKTLHLEACDK